MTLSRKQLLLAAGLFLTASTALASSPLQTGFYVGGNSGASFVTNQASGDLHVSRENREVNEIVVVDQIHDRYSEESSIRGYNGGVFVGWNFYCDESWFHGVELSGDFFSNRGRFNFGAPYGVTHRQGSEPDAVIDVRQVNFQDVYDLEFALNLAFKPGAKINDSTVLFGILGASWARFDSEVHQVRGRRDNDRREGSFAVAHQDEDRDEHHHHHHDNDNEQDLWGFVLGAGVQTQVTHYMSAFASYQYTYYGNKELDNVRDHRREHRGEDEGRRDQPFVDVHHRNSTIDTNIFKVGVVFNF